MVGGQSQAQRAAHRQADGHDRVVLGGELVVRPLDRRDPVGPRDLVEVLPAGAVAGQQRHLDGVPARGEVLGPRPHRHRVAGEPVLDEHADPATAGELGSGRRRHRGDEGGVQGRRRARRGTGSSRRTVCTTLLGGRAARERSERPRNPPSPGTVARVTTPGDESRTELAWREIVEHYGERPVLDDDARPPHVDRRRRPAEPGRGRARRARGRRPTRTTRGRRRPSTGSSRLRPPPFPTPRTWQRGAGLGRHLRGARAGAAHRRCSRSTSRRSSAGRWWRGSSADSSTWSHMPRAPRDPWDDGSRI